MRQQTSNEKLILNKIQKCKTSGNFSEKQINLSKLCSILEIYAETLPWEKSWHTFWQSQKTANSRIFSWKIQTKFGTVWEYSVKTEESENIQSIKTATEMDFKSHFNDPISNSLQTRNGFKIKLMGFWICVQNAKWSLCFSQRFEFQSNVQSTFLVFIRPKSTYQTKLSKIVVDQHYKSFHCIIWNFNDVRLHFGAQ